MKVINKLVKGKGQESMKHIVSCNQRNQRDLTLINSAIIGIVK